MSVLTDKTVVLCVTGSIAAYKAVEIARLFVKQGAKVRVVMTLSAAKFVSPQTFQAITHVPVVTDIFDQTTDTGADHIALAREAHVVVVAPATANTLAKCAYGMADNAVTTTLLAAQCPILMAPAMESAMWDHPATQENIDTLQTRGVNMIAPEEGELASGDMGMGRMSDPETIVDSTRYILSRGERLAGKTMVVTCGPTREYIDPVRYITNASSGKMGMAIATCARDQGADVIVISGPIALPIPVGIECMSVTTAEEMKEAVIKQMPHADVLFGVAAVSDFAPQKKQATKMKKTTSTMTMQLMQTPDVLVEVAKWKEVHRASTPITVGFALETDHGKQNAQKKLSEKALDVVVLNSIETLEADTIDATILRADSDPLAVGRVAKSELARALIDAISVLA